MADEYIQQIIDIIRPIAKSRDPIEAHTRIIEDGIIDSLSVINLIMEIERAFEIKIGIMDVTINDFETPAKIAEIIDRKKRG